MIKYSLFLFLFLFMGCKLFSQVGIGTVTPRAALDISNTTGGGVLVPKYALTVSNDIKTVSNPQGAPLEVGTLIYNTANVAGQNSISEGFVYWDGNKWNRIVPKTEIMMRRFTAGGIGGEETVFNFPSESFNTINASSYHETAIILPTGTYMVESNIRVDSNNTVDWITRLDGNEVAGSVHGSSNPTTFNTNASTIQGVAVFNITASTGVLDFKVTGGVGATTLPNQCYVLIRKLN